MTSEPEFSPAKAALIRLRPVPTWPASSYLYEDDEDGGASVYLSLFDLRLRTAPNLLTRQARKYRQTL